MAQASLVNTSYETRNAMHHESLYFDDVHDVDVIRLRHTFN